MGIFYELVHQLKCIAKKSEKVQCASEEEKSNAGACRVWLGWYIYYKNHLIKTVP